MSDDLHFSSNYRDLCQQNGTGAGFQFEFYCQGCSDTWRSPFAPYRSGQASGWMRELGSFASNLLGGIGGSLDEAVDGLAKAGWGTSRDAAFKDAITAAQGALPSLRALPSVRVRPLLEHRQRPVPGLRAGHRHAGAGGPPPGQARGGHRQRAGNRQVAGRTGGRRHRETAGLPAMRMRSARRQVLSRLRAQARRAQPMRRLPGRVAGRQPILPRMRNAYGQQPAQHRLTTRALD